MNVRSLSFLAVIAGLAIILLIGSDLLQHKAFASNEVDDKYITARMDIHNQSQLLSAPEAFARGEMIDFYGYVDGYTQLPDDANATFNVTITGPDKAAVFNQEFVADEIGGQDIITFKYEIPQDARFGMYEVSFTVHKPGHKELTPESTDPLVSVGISRFFVLWTEDEIIDETGKYRLELSISRDYSEPLQFGSYAEIMGKLCPSPVSSLPSFSDRDSVNNIKTDIRPIDEEQAASVIRSNIIPFTSDDACAEPFIISNTGILAASGRWVVNSTAEWTDGENAYRVKSDQLVFNVGGSLYRTNNITGISLDDERFARALPLDWSKDRSSILFRYEGPDDAPRLAILPVEWSEGEMKPNKEAIMDFGNLTVANDSMNPDSYLDLVVARFGGGQESKSIYFVLGPDVYKYDVKDAPASDLSPSSAERLPNVRNFIDILHDGRIAFVDGDELMFSSSDGENAKTVATIKDLYSFDVSSDGKRVLYAKILDSGYGYTNAVLAYTDLESGESHEVPNIKISCGSASWAPNNYDIIIWDDLCWRASGAGLAVSDIDGNFKDYLVPISDDNPTSIISPDGKYALIGFYGYSEGQARDYMGPHSDFYLMALARPVPEFSQMSFLAAGGMGFVAVILVYRALHKIPDSHRI